MTNIRVGARGRTLRVAIVGCGGIAHQHARAYAEQAYTGSVRSDDEGSDPHLEGTRQSIGFLRSMRKATT